MPELKVSVTKRNLNREVAIYENDQGDGYFWIAYRRDIHDNQIGIGLSADRFDFPTVEAAAMDGMVMLLGAINNGVISAPELSLLGHEIPELPPTTEKKGKGYNGVWTAERREKQSQIMKQRYAETAKLKRQLGG